jgi:phospholipase C
MTKTRRNFLKTAAGASALALLPPNLRAALAAPLPRRTGTIADVEHVVIFMQENRSFDHYFGTLKGVRGFNDPRAIRLPGGQAVWHQPNGKDTVSPFHLDTKSTSAQFLHSLDHSWKGSHDLWKNHDAWIPTKTELTMGYFTRADIPFYYALADAFTICDAYHCSVFGPTNPNRLHLFSGTSGLTVGNEAATVVVNPPDEENETADMANDSKGFKPFEWTTYAERLQKAGIDWRVYQEYDNFGDNALAYFANFRAGVPQSDLHTRARMHAEGSNAANAKDSRGEHLVSAFAKDAAENRLPQISWIVASAAMSEHPYAPPSYGESLTSRLLDALAANPEVWAKTAFILNYDENDGFFDHVPPPVPAITPDLGASTVSVTGESYQGVPFGFGPRVPLIVVSPWTAGGFVNSQIFDHTSVLRFLETRFGVAEPNISPWRRAVAGDLTSAFDFAQSQTPPLPDGTDGVSRANAQKTLPAAARKDEALPRQEAGQRPARPLPYDLDVTGASVKNGFALDFVNRGGAGAVFRVSAAAGGPWFFTVEAGKSLSHTLPCDGPYDFVLHGPNGFYRRFANGGADTISATFKHDGTSDAILGNFVNNGSETVTLTLHNRYARVAHPPIRLKPGVLELLSVPVEPSANWYDLLLEGPGGFVRHAAGHIEDGKASMSDPLLG